MIIDVHAHALHRPFLAELARQGAFGVESRGAGFGFAGYGELDPLLFDMPGRLASLKARAITLQLVAPPPRIVSDAHWAADAAFARRLNRQTAALVAEGEGRVTGLAVPVLADPTQARDEVCRAMDEEGLVGVALPTSVAGRSLDDGAFEGLFAECARRRCPVFMHPTTGVDRPALSNYTMLQLVGWPSETALCVGRMIFAGVFERYPDLKLILAHGGGTLLALAGRLDLAYEAPHYEANPACRVNISRAPSTYLHQILFDTVIAHPGLLRCVIDLVGPGNVVFGTDFPFEIGDPEGAKSLPVLNALDAPKRDKILFGTMQEVLAAAANGIR